MHFRSTPIVKHLTFALMPSPCLSKWLDVVLLHLSPVNSNAHYRFDWKIIKAIRKVTVQLQFFFQRSALADRSPRIDQIGFWPASNRVSFCPLTKCAILWRSKCGEIHNYVARYATKKPTHRFGWLIVVEPSKRSERDTAYSNVQSTFYMRTFEGRQSNAYGWYGQKHNRHALQPIHQTIAIPTKNDKQHICRFYMAVHFSVALQTIVELKVARCWVRHTEPKHGVLVRRPRQLVCRNSDMPPRYDAYKMLDSIWKPGNSWALASTVHQFQLKHTI